MKATALFAITLLAAIQHGALCENRPKCKGNPKIVAACFSIHARANIGADSVPIYLWPVGSHRRLGVTGGPTLDDSIDPIYPKNLHFDSADDTIFGDFEVCPFTPEKKDHLRLVCIESAAHLLVKH
jgi:hypothetical protein